MQLGRCKMSAVNYYPTHFFLTSVDTEEQKQASIKGALNLARAAYANGFRHYDEKHKTYNPATKVENLLSHVSEMLGYFELLAYDPQDSNPSAPKYSYINSGDTYALTLVYNHDRQAFVFSDIGSIIEREQILTTNESEG